MAEELLKYVENQLRAGYSHAQIKQALINRGYDANVVEGIVDSVSMRSLNSPPMQSNSNFLSSSISKKIVFSVIGIVVLVGIGFFIASIFGKEALLDVMTSPEKQVYHPGEAVGFNIQIFNMGSKDKFDVTLNYRILDSNDNLISGSEETIAISTSASHRKQINFPSSMRPGEYTLKAFATYDGKIATSAFSFTVEPKPVTEPTQPTPNQNTQQNTTSPTIPSKPTPTSPTASCTDGIRNQDEIGIDCGGACGGFWYDLSCHSFPRQQSTEPTVKSTGTLILEARMIAKTDPQSAMQICNGFNQESTRDACIKSVAQSSMQSSFCELIINDSERDLCYYPFFMKGDYSVCELLVTKESLETCAQLKEISQINNQ